jgi:hypothetical protein
MQVRLGIGISGNHNAVGAVALAFTSLAGEAILYSGVELSKEIG